MAQEQKWPDRLWLVRHGQSAGNVARDAAEAASQALIDTKDRDMDVPLSPLGRQQAESLGHWFGAQPSEEQPSVVLCSPYLRAGETARIMLAASGIDADSVILTADERLREKEFGAFDRLTKIGIAQKYPDLHEQRAHVGKFYFRPPGGESWCDVILRLRSTLDMITREHRRERVLIVAHQVIVNCYRYLLERLDEQTILEIDRQADMPNCSVTSYAFDGTAGRHGKLVPRLVNFTAPLAAEGTPVTAEKDQPTKPR